MFLDGAFDGTAWNLHRNGQLIASTPSVNGAASTVNVSRWTMGSRFDSPSPTHDFNDAADYSNEVWQAEGQLFGGSIDEPASFDKALSASEIASGYASAVVTPASLATGGLKRGRLFRVLRRSRLKRDKGRAGGGREGEKKAPGRTHQGGEGGEPC